MGRRGPVDPNHVPDLEGVRKFKIPGICTVDLDKILKRYNQQKEGQRYTAETVLSDLAKIDEQFKMVATATHLRFSENYSIPAIAGYLGIEPRRVQGWFRETEAHLPSMLSLKNYARYKRSRHELAPDLTADNEWGYVGAALVASRVNPIRSKKGVRNFVLVTNSEGVRKELVRAASKTTGLTVETKTTPPKKPTHNPRHEVLISSANLAPFMSSGQTDARKVLSFVRNSPEARLSTVRGLYDLSKLAELILKPERNGMAEAVLKHDDKKVMDFVSGVLNEHGIDHVRTSRKGKHAVVISNTVGPANVARRDNTHLRNFMRIIAPHHEKYRAIPR